MSRIFLTEKEAQDWGLLPKKFDTHSFKQKVVIRVVAGVIILAITLAIAWSQTRTVNTQNSSDPALVKVREPLCT
jgi:hypothetical protein